MQAVVTMTYPVSGGKYVHVTAVNKLYIFASELVRGNKENIGRYISASVLDRFHFSSDALLLFATEIAFWESNINC